MFDIGFSEILVIFILALVVLGPEKLPRVVREVGRWVGRARAMARQFQEQLEDEVDVDRGRTIRPQPVRPVGGVPPADAAPLMPEHGEPQATPTPPSQSSVEAMPEAAAAGADGPSDPSIPGTHERGT
ncbi:MAG: twin-arginine translocase subunit TatB [Proteobacteria bacterium]|nr:twin-arginine translocase subunit TatB [Pseudomonadota bacterium]